MKSALHTIKRKNAQGFTLIELLVVIGILAVLLAIVLVAINPQRQFAQANNTQRKSDVTAILNALNAYMADSGGDLPTATQTGTAISATATNIGSGTGNVDLCKVLVTKYIADMPIDPSKGSKSYTSGDCTQTGATYSTDYKISVSADDNRITITAPDAQLDESISVTR